MDEIMLPHVLSRLDAIREQQIRDSEAVSEMRHLLRQPAPALKSAVAQTTVVAAVTSRMEAWLLSLKPIALLFTMGVKHAVAVGTIWYMIKTGQGDKIAPYVSWLLGM